MWTSADTGNGTDTDDVADEDVDSSDEDLGIWVQVLVGDALTAYK